MRGDHIYTVDFEESMHLLVYGPNPKMVIFGYILREAVVMNDQEP